MIEEPSRLVGVADTGAGRKGRGTARQQSLPKWPNRGPDRGTGGRAKVAAGIDVVGGERRQFPESTGRT